MPPRLRTIVVAVSVVAGCLAAIAPALRAQQPDTPPPSTVPRETRPSPRATRAPQQGPSRPDPRRGQILVTADAACEVSVDFKKVATLEAGGHATLTVEPGERLIAAVGRNGATWKEKVKVGSEQVIVEIKLACASAPASAADFDAASAALVDAVADVRGAGSYVAWVLDKKPFGYHDVDLTVSLQRAAVRLKREQERAGGMQAPDPARGRAAKEVARAGGEAEKMAAMLSEAASIAQQENTSLGRSAQLRAQALAHVPLMALDGGAMAALHGSQAFRSALPRDRWPDAGLAADAQDVRLGADYDGDSPPRLGEVPKGSLADALGLRAGDRVVSVDGRPVRDAWALKLALRAAAGRSVEVGLERDRKPETKKVKVPASLTR